jgi:primase-like protein/bifunctional DNA primase/polymerase-like protein
VEDLSQSHCDVNLFGRLQADYAAHGVATFPVDANKRPMVSRYNRFGLVGSSEIANKFAHAPAIGFMGGSRNGVTVLDVDTTDERVLADALDRHGNTPIIVRSGSGHFHVRPDVPIDILGGGVVIGPPSRTAKGEYQFISGSLDDLGSLPTLNDAPRLQPASDLLADWGGMRNGDGRNNALFRLLGRAARNCDDFEQLLDYAVTRNGEFGEPMEDAELVKVAQSVWKMQCEGRSRFGQFGAWFPIGIVNQMIKDDQDAMILETFLQAHNGPWATFMCANGMAERFGWGRYRLAKARRRLIELGRIIPIRAAVTGTPALYRWANR